MIKGYSFNPIHGETQYELTDSYWLRMFSMAAMQGVMSDPNVSADEVRIAQFCVKHAKALLAEIKKMETHNE